jgi:hypothetical protein
MEPCVDVEMGVVAARTWGQPAPDQFVLLHGAGGNAAFVPAV